MGGEWDRRGWSVGKGDRQTVDNKRERERERGNK